MGVGLAGGCRRLALTIPQRRPCTNITRDAPTCMMSGAAYPPVALSTSPETRGPRVLPTAMAPKILPKYRPRASGSALVRSAA